MHYANISLSDKEWSQIRRINKSISYNSSFKQSGGKSLYITNCIKMPRSEENEVNFSCSPLPL
jgi:hypothetical protein